jgi:hypothetical protein
MFSGVSRFLGARDESSQCPSVRKSMNLKNHFYILLLLLLLLLLFIFIKLFFISVNNLEYVECEK